MSTIFGYNFKMIKTSLDGEFECVFYKTNFKLKKKIVSCQGWPNLLNIVTAWLD
jgi:hypothetical protein